jgi:penicillin-binding protein 1C
VVALDPLTGRPRCPPFPADTRFEVFDFWSSDTLELFRRAGVPRRTPPAMPACAADTLDAPRIASPLRGVSYALRQSSPQEEIALEAHVAADVRTVLWFDGRALIGSRRVADGPLPWRPATAGIRVVRIVDDHGRSAEREVDVQIGR